MGNFFAVLELEEQDTSDESETDAIAAEAMQKQRKAAAERRQQQQQQKKRHLKEKAAEWEKENNASHLMSAADWNLQENHKCSVQRARGDRESASQH